MTISQLIAELERFKKQHGDVPVVLSVDTEGNSFGTTHPNDTLCPALDDNEDVAGVILYPYAEGFEDPYEAVKFKG